MGTTHHAIHTDAARNLDDVVREGRIIPPYVAVPQWVLFAGISSVALHVYTVLLARVNAQRGDSKAWPSQKSIAAIVGKSEDTVSRVVTKELAPLGLVDVDVQRYGTNNTRRRNVYTVHQLPPEGWAKPVSIAEWDRTSKTDIPGHRMDASPESAPARDRTRIHAAVNKLEGFNYPKGEPLSLAEPVSDEAPMAAAVTDERETISTRKPKQQTIGALLTDAGLPVEQHKAFKTWFKAKNPGSGPALLRHVCRNGDIVEWLEDWSDAVAKHQTDMADVLPGDRNAAGWMALARELAAADASTGGGQQKASGVRADVNSPWARIDLEEAVKSGLPLPPWCGERDCDPETRRCADPDPLSFGGKVRCPRCHPAKQAAVTRL
jgi:hypothetical protein